MAARSSLLRRLAALHEEQAAVFEQLADLELVTEPSTSASYATKPSHAWPPGARSERSARDRIRDVPGHAHPERGLWVVAKDLYARRHAKPVLRVVAPRGDHEEDDQAIARRALEAAGFRSTKRSA